ncbi:MULTISPECIES: iron-sulfur cluster biosynthesis family protein [Bacillaceae]|uniref:Iron-sulfur cluster biosynthesis family protein n=1 Tax=Evansella alkalicola TaxID=745819 RepID=A0ABS6JWJ3_9BACI|nr:MULTISPECIES: iron-sulfur cluster biosynthesis family protein [Bacillaceae]MBU9722446.1 iron-sulfur cluster biosynthesis family protein [Bacillus alkalicola]
MQVTITEKAIQALKNKSNTITDNYLFLKYDIDGCGCVVSGVSLLKEKESIDQGEAEADMEGNSPIQVTYEKQYDWVYDEKLTVDYHESGTFQLKSPNQMLNPRMRYFAK